MPQFVRSSLRFNRWLDTEGREPGDFPADVITDLLTKGDKLSVYEIDEDHPITAERVAIAVLAGKQNPAETAYGVFDRAAVEALGIETIKTQGGTYDAEVNGSHYDLHVGSAAKLLELAGVIAKGHIVALLKKRVIELLRAGFESGQIDHTRNKPLCDAVNAQIARPH